MVFLQLPNHDYLVVMFWSLLALVTLGDHSVETATFWIMAFVPVLNKHQQIFLPFIPTLLCHLVPGLAASVFA